MSSSQSFFVCHYTVIHSMPVSLSFCGWCYLYQSLRIYLFPLFFVCLYATILCMFLLLLFSLCLFLQHFLIFYLSRSLYRTSLSITFFSFFLSRRFSVCVLYFILSLTILLPQWIPCLSLSLYNSHAVYVSRSLTVFLSPFNQLSFSHSLFFQHFPSAFHWRHSFWTLNWCTNWVHCRPLFISPVYKSEQQLPV